MAKKTTSKAGKAEDRSGSAYLIVSSETADSAKKLLKDIAISSLNLEQAAVGDIIVNLGPRSENLRQLQSQAEKLGVRVHYEDKNAIKALLHAFYKTDPEDHSPESPMHDFLSDAIDGGAALPKVLMNTFELGGFGLSDGPAELKPCTSRDLVDWGEGNATGLSYGAPNATDRLATAARADAIRKAAEALEGLSFSCTSPCVPRVDIVLGNPRFDISDFFGHGSVAGVVMAYVPWELYFNCVPKVTGESSNEVSIGPGAKVTKCGTEHVRKGQGDGVYSEWESFSPTNSAVEYFLKYNEFKSRVIREATRLAVEDAKRQLEIEVRFRLAECPPISCPNRKVTVSLGAPVVTLQTGGISVYAWLQATVKVPWRVAVVCAP